MEANNKDTLTAVEASVVAVVHSRAIDDQRVVAHPRGSGVRRDVFEPRVGDVHRCAISGLVVDPAATIYSRTSNLSKQQFYTAQATVGLLVCLGPIRAN